MRLDSLTIALFYESPEVGVWSMFDLTEHRGVIAPEELEPEAFFNVAGAIRLYCDRFKCFLNTGAAGELRNYVYFLLESLVSLTGRELADEFPEVTSDSSFLGEDGVLAGLFQDNQTRIVLQNATRSEAAISFLDPEGKAPEHRLSPYFRGILVEKQTWQAAATEALNEYFSVAGERLQPASKCPLSELASCWTQHRAVLSNAQRIT